MSNSCLEVPKVQFGVLEELADRWCREERLSAVAKRRRLNGNASTTTESAVDVDLSPQNSAQTIEVQGNSARGSELLSSSTLEPDANEFAPLFDNKIVQFSNSREIERLNEGALRIRLSKGQRCVISGTYTLWVKHGSMRMNGAAINESVKLYCVDTNIAFEVPAITAISKIVEFEVISRNNPTPAFGGQILQCWMSEVTRELYYASFFVHGYSTFLDGQISAPIKSFDDSFVNNVAHRISSWSLGESQASGPTILVRGKQYPGTASSLLAIINSTITANTVLKAGSCADGILFLDLEFDLPIFSPPGTINLAHIQEPILGSPYLNLGSVSPNNNTDKVRLLLLNHARFEENTTHRTRQLHSLCSIIDEIRKAGYQRCPLIIRSKDCFEQIFLQHSEMKTTVLAPNIVILLGQENDHKSVRPTGRTREEQSELLTILLPLSANQGPSLHVQHEMLLRSYFHFCGYQMHCARWSLLPLELNQCGHIWLRYGKGSDVALLVPFQLRDLDADDLAEALNGSIVVMVSHKRVNFDHSIGSDLQDNHITKSCDRNMNSSTTSEGHCLGIGIIAGFDRENQAMCVITPAALHNFDLHQRQGNTVHLHVQPAYSDGRFDTAWIQQELETFLDSGRAPKYVCRRNLDIRRSVHA